MSLFKKRGGGFLNGVNGVIEGYKFDSKVWNEGEKSEYTTLSVELLVKQDGADEPVQQFLQAGFLHDDDAVSDDGLTIEGEGGPIVQEDSEFGRFLGSMIEVGMAEEDFDASGRNFEPIIGKRVTFAKEMNVERQMAAGKKKLGSKAKTSSEEEILAAGRRQDKKDKTKFYNHDRLIVTAILGEAEAAPKAAKAAKGKPVKAAAKPAVTAKGGKANGAAKSEEDYEAADALLIDLLASAKGNTINKGSISSAIVRKALEDDMADTDRDAFRKLLSNEDYLARENGWSYDAADKKGPISLSA